MRESEIRTKDKKERRHEQKASQPRSKGRKGEDTMSCCQGIRDEKSQTHPDRRRRRPTHTQKNGNVLFFFSFRTASSFHKPQSRSILPLPPFSLLLTFKKHNRENSLGVRKKVAPLLLLAFWLHELLNPCFSSSSFLNAVICRWGGRRALQSEKRRAAWIGWFFFFSSKVIFGSSGGLAPEKKEGEGAVGGGTGLKLGGQTPHQLLTLAQGVVVEN